MDGAVEGSRKAFGDLGCGVGEIRDQNGEFVPTHPRDGVTNADIGLDSLAHTAQQLVAGLITQCVDDYFEVLDSNAEYADGDGMVVVQLHRIRQPLVK